MERVSSLSPARQDALSALNLRPRLGMADSGLSLGRLPHESSILNPGDDHPALRFHVEEFLQVNLS